MKLPLKHITLLVMLSLTGIFAYQVYWLTGLYRTMNRNLQQQIAEGMRMADYNEMILRLERLSSDSTEHGTIQVDAGLSNDNYYLQSRVTRSGQPVPSEQTASDTLVVSATDSLKTREEARWSKALLKMNEGMNVVLQKQDNMQRLAQYFQKGLHAGIDEVLPTQLADYDSLLWEQLKPLNLQVPYQLLQLHSGARYDGSGAYTDTLARLSTPGYRPSADAHRFTCYLDVHNHRAYELTLEPIDSIVLQQMKGILVTSLIILLILGGAFGYLIRTLLQQKTLEEMKSDFTNNITHELKTPIAVAYAANDALLHFGQADDKEKRNKYLTICQEQLQQLSGLVEQILSMSMERRKTFRLHPEELQLSEVIQPLLEQHRLKADKPVRFRVDIEPGDLTVLADRTHFSNILSNLLDNAIKYSLQEANITIRGRKQTDQVVISITDHGIGIAPERIKHLFDKFYRVPTGNLHAVKGYGLGLFYVKTLVKKHGGRIAVKSEPGKGSTFTLLLQTTDERAYPESNL